MLQFDEEASRRLVAMYTTPDVVEQRRQVLAVADAQPGEQVLDVGVGPGFLARNLAELVGARGSVHGTDISDAILAVARDFCADRSNVILQTADAVNLPFAEACFDLAVSTQVYEYVADVPRALAELYRVLRPGGRALVLDTDWDSIVWNAGNPYLRDRILEAWKEHATDSHLPRVLTSLLLHAGFEIERRDVLVLFNPDYDGNTYSQRAAALIAGFVVDHQGISQADIDDWLRDQRRLGERREYFFSLNRYLFLARKPNGPSR